MWILLFLSVLNMGNEFASFSEKSRNLESDYVKQVKNTIDGTMPHFLSIPCHKLCLTRASLSNRFKFPASSFYNRPFCSNWRHSTKEIVAQPVQSNIFISCVARYYSPTAMKCTSFLFGIGGILLADDIQQVNKVETITFGQRLLVDACSGFCFAFGGFYLHMFLPAFLFVVVPLILLFPDDEAVADESDESPK